MNRLLAAIGLSAILALATPWVASAKECVPQDAFTEETDWVLESPGPKWYQIDQRTVVDDPGGAVVVTEAQHYSYTGGPIEGLPTTTPPGADWQANTHQEPHLNNPNVTWVDGFGVGLHYTSRGGSGLADFFYFQPEVTEEVPPTTHDEFRFALDHKAVECDNDGKPKPPPGDDGGPKDRPKDKKLPRDLAMTGLSAGPAAILGGVMLALGGFCLWLSRRFAA